LKWPARPRAKADFKTFANGRFENGVASSEFYNSLEAPALEKFPVLALFLEFLRGHTARWPR
jgi:hypothetical protein